eukprot:gene7673-10442_t
MFGTKKKNKSNQPEEKTTTPRQQGAKVVEVDSDHPAFNPAETITITRSDGRVHDLSNVFSNINNVNSAAAVEQQAIEQQASVDSKSKDETNRVDDHGHRISITRSDAISHDVIQVLKSQSEVKPDQFRLSATQPSLTNINIRTFLSSGRIEVREDSQRRQSLNEKGIIPMSVRIVHMSDTHNFLSSKGSKNFLPRGDILVHSGDFSNYGTDEEYSKFNSWLGSVKDLYHYRVIVIGSKDVKTFGNNWAGIKSRLTEATHVLCHSEATILGLRFYGCPWHWGYKVNYTLRPGAPQGNGFDRIPEGIDVLVTHAPAYQRLDSVISINGEAFEHWGSKELLDAVKRTKPSLHLVGHIHEARGVLLGTSSTPLCVNSCMCDNDKTVMFACPHVIKATQIPLPPGSDIKWHFKMDSLEI